MSKRIVVAVSAVLAVAVLAVSAAGASRGSHVKPASSHLLVGINDEAFTLYGNPTTAFPALKALNAKVLRVNLYWGGTQWAVANKKPADPTDPGDPAYDWALYDRLVRYATQYGVKVMFSVLFTPGWANGHKPRTVAPTNPLDLQKFAYAAAERYSGLWAPPEWQQDPTNPTSALPLPKVSYWTAWNEPNSPVWLTPQYKKVAGKWRVESAYQYAKICNAVYNGVHAPALGPLPGEKVACGVTDPKGNNNPGASRSSVDPISFLVNAKKYGMKTFDVYAHNPYPAAGTEAPNYVPSGKGIRRIQLGNIGALISEVGKLYGPKHLWLTEYAYQTNPPNKSIFGVTWAKQAAYLKQAVALARANPRIDMMLWFLVKDDSSKLGWQSGLETTTGRHKPSWSAFVSAATG